MRTRGRIRGSIATLVAAVTAVGLAGVIVAVPVAQPAGAQVPTNRWLTELRIANMAHGGGLREAPQGTMYAYQTADERGADLLEMDLHITLDGHVIAMHDSTVDRTTDGTGCIVAKTLAEIKALDAAYTFVPGVGPRPGRPPEDTPLRGVRTGEVAPPAGFTADDFSVVTLEELFTELPDALMLMELKPTEVYGVHDCPAFVESLPPDERPDLAAEVARLIDAYDMTEKVMVASFIDELMADFQALAPDVDTSFPMGEAVAVYLAYLGGQPLPNPNGHEAMQVPTSFGDIALTEDLVDYARSNGVAVHFWTINDPAQMHELLDWGVDGLITDDVAVLDGVLDERGDPRPLADSSTELTVDGPVEVDVGTPLSIAVTVEPGWPHPTPTGTVELVTDAAARDAGAAGGGARAVVATAELDAEGRAVFVVDDLTAGLHTLTAAYAGSSRLHPSVSAAVTVEVVGDQPLESTTSSTAPTSSDPSASSSSVASSSDPGGTDPSDGSGSYGGYGSVGSTSIPRTGYDPVPLVALAAALLAVGAVVTAASRRRTNAAHRR